jgi:hypothetical protein
MREVLAPASHRTEERVIVKIDAEGAECEIILETPGEVWRAVDEVFVEVHDFARCTSADLAQHLGSAGLDVIDESFAVLHLRRRLTPDLPETSAR